MQSEKSYIPKHREPSANAATTPEEVQEPVAPVTPARSTSSSPHTVRRRNHTESKHRSRGTNTWTTLLIVFVFVAVAILLSFLIHALGGSAPEEADNPEAPIVTTAEPEQTLVSFVAVGDNLPEIAIGTYGDANAGELGDGLYDYRPIYEPIKPFIETADLAYICFETHAGGDEIGPRGWPSFNTTDAMVDAVADTGFDLIATATNHSYDWGFDALSHSALLWEQYDVLFAGTASDPESASVINTIERNGIVFSLLSYTYGVNGYEESEIPSYAVNYMHEARIQSDIAAAREISDVVMVSMHWGTENYTGADDTQLYYAQLIADAGADVVLGSHPHVVGPVRWIDGASGNKTLVAFSLGNFLSHHDIPYPLNELGGMLSCDFVKDSEGVRIEHVQWTPLVNHSEETLTQIYRLQDYTAELALRHRIFGSYEDPLAWFKVNTAEIIGSEIAIAE